MTLTRCLRNAYLESWLAISLALAMLLTLATAKLAAAATNLIHVTSTVPGDTRGLGPNGSQLCSLQEAIDSANFDTNGASLARDTAGNFYTSGCEPGSGDDTIVLQDSATYTLSSIVGDDNNRYGPTATPVIFSNITIEGHGATIQLATGAPNMRAFSVGFDSVDLNPGGTPNVVSGWGNLTIQNVRITGFHVKGGNGGIGGGGGGLGAGGAIYVDSSSSNGVGGLTVVNSTLDNNTATGGNGGAGNSGGGGGGFAGNGGEGTGSCCGAGSDGSGAGGGGAQGDGAAGAAGADVGVPGSGGGGTVGAGMVGGTSGIFAGGASGFACGGKGADQDSVFGGGSNGDDGCAGGGGGGGSSKDTTRGTLSNFLSGGNGGQGGYGGGGGGGGYDDGNGGGSKFGGGGGAGMENRDCTLSCGANGGNGGFGGGGGGNGKTGDGNPGAGGGGWGGRASVSGGGGGALGGAIFSDSSTVLIQNSTFFNNVVTRGVGGGGGADNGADAGGAIFARNGSLTVQYATISANQGTGSGDGIVVQNDGSATSFTLDNTIISSNLTHECFFRGSVTVAGSGNLIQDNFGCPGAAVIGVDPQLGPLQLNTPGNTPTMALSAGSPALGAADPAATQITTDQRGVQRKPAPDIGAYELAPPSADLSLTKAISSSTAQPGNTLTYTLAVNNAGPNVANSVTVSDNWPSLLTFVSCIASNGGSCGFSGSSVTATYATLAVGETETITVQGTLIAGAVDNLTVVNTASVSASSPTDPKSNNDAASSSFTVHNRADLVVTKQASAAQVVAGDSFTYTINLSNAGPYDASGVVLSDTQPTGVTFNSCISTVGTCSLSGGIASVSLASLLNGASATLTIQATLNFGVADGSTVTNTASVTSSTFDPNLSNNSGSANIIAQNKSDLFITKKANLTSVKPLANLVYTVVVKNLGPYRAAAVVMNDPVPANTTFVSLSAGGASCSAPVAGTVGTVTCNFGNIANGASSPTITITVKVNGSGNKTSITNTAVTNSPNFDPNLANNTASVTTQIYGNKK